MPILSEESRPLVPNTSKPIELTREETYALESVLKNDDTEEGVRVAKPLLLKLGSAFIQQNQDGSELTPVTLALTEKEAWLARDRIPVTMQIGHQPVGLTLKKKIYRILLEFDTEAQAGEIVEDLAAAVEPPLTGKEAAERLTAAQPWVKHPRDAQGRFRRRGA